MSKLREGDAFMPAAEYGRSLPQFSVNLLVRDVAASVAFYRDVLGVEVSYADKDFAALELRGWKFMLHADHTYDHHPLYSRLSEGGLRGSGAELRVLGIDPDKVEQRARHEGAAILQPAKDFPHGWRDVTIADPDGYVWAVGVTIGT